MQRMSLIGRYIPIGIFILFLLGGCSLYDQFFEGDEEMLPGELMSEALEEMESGNYKSATEKFQELKDRYPYSEFAVEAELKMADSLFQQRKYDAAYDAYDEFERMHPKDRTIPYVIYRKGMSNFRQVETIDRDQSRTLKAREEFERLIARFPKNEYVNRARKNIRKCLIYLAEYELYVGNYYYTMENYRAAMDRYIYLIQTYPDMGQYHDALEYISRCKEKLAEVAEKE